MRCSSESSKSMPIPMAARACSSVGLSFLNDKHRGKFSHVIQAFDAAEHTYESLAFLGAHDISNEGTELLVDLVIRKRCSGGSLGVEHHLLEQPARFGPHLD